MGEVQTGKKHTVDPADQGAADDCDEQKNDRINAMADLLLEKETIYAEDIERILGPSAQSAKRAAGTKPEEGAGGKAAADELTEA